MAKRTIIKIGDIFCVEIDSIHKCYFQYICNDMCVMDSPVIKVFRTHYPLEFNPTLEEISNDDVVFYAHTIIRNGINSNSWYKVGTCKSTNLNDSPKIVWGYTQNTLSLSAWETITVNPMENWDIWYTNEFVNKIGVLPRYLWDSIEIGSIKPYIDIVNRIKYGYYKYSSPAYDIIKRIPHPDVHSYVKRETNETVKYMHFLGENVMQEIIIKEDSLVEISGGYLLDRPKFWETNWDFDDFITEDEFNEAWNKYSQQTRVLPS